MSKEWPRYNKEIEAIVAEKRNDPTLADRWNKASRELAMNPPPKEQMGLMVFLEDEDN